MHAPLPDEAAQIENRIRAVIARTFGIPIAEAAGDLRMGNPLAWDSIGHMQLMFALESEFGMTFPTYQIAELQSVPDIVRAISSQGC
jgi:acyl carrier protein